MRCNKTPEELEEWSTTELREWSDYWDFFTQEQWDVISEEVLPFKELHFSYSFQVPNGEEYTFHIRKIDDARPDNLNTTVMFVNHE